MRAGRSRSFFVNRRVPQFLNHHFRFVVQSFETLPLRCTFVRLTLVLVFASFGVAQDLAPRAYVITPLNSNAIVVTWSYYHGGVDLNGTVPITGATGSYSVSILSVYHTFDLLGRSANVTASLPYAVGTFSGDVLGTDRSIYRSGLADFSARISVNLIGGPSMRPDEFVKWRQKTVLGASLKIVTPTGQYDGARLVNWGINRWAFKPELGLSRRWGSWMLDAYAGVWFYTKNPEFYSIHASQPQTEEPIGSLEGHLSRDFRKVLGLRGWASLDGNFWWGGITSLSGIRNLETRQTSSRIGATVSLPFTRRQSVKLSYSVGTYVRFGGNYHNLQVAWQYSWIGAPR